MTYLSQLGLLRQNTITWWLKQQEFISHSTGKYRSKVLAGSVSGEGSLLGLQTAIILLGPHIEASCLLSLLIKPYRGLYLCELMTSPKPHLQILSPCEAELQHKNLGCAHFCLQQHGNCVHESGRGRVPAWVTWNDEGVGLKKVTCRVLNGNWRHMEPNTSSCIFSGSKHVSVCKQIPIM